MTTRKIFGIFNSRPLAIATLYLAAGILLGVYRPPLVAVWFCCLALSALYLYLFKILSYRALPLVLICLCLSLPLLAYPTYLDKNLCYDKNVTAEGRILEAVYGEKDNEYLVDDLFINGERYGGKMKVTSSYEFECGERIFLKGYLKTYDFSSDTYSLKRICYREYYDLSVNVAYSLSYQGLPFREKIMNYVKKGFAENADYQTSAFTMSVLFGESGGLESLSAYRETNLAHLFAVSGLHVGTLTAALYFILVKIFRRRKNSPTVFISLCGVLAFYSYLCGFTPSVIRALIMTVIAALSRPLRFYPDRLSILGVAAITSLAVRPLWLFDVSFLLSYSAILGIILLQPALERGLSKTKTPSKIKSALSMNLAVSAAVMPVSAYFFGKVSLLSLPLSLFFIPFVSLLFTCFFILSPFAGLPFVAYPLVPLSLGVKLCDGLVNLFDKLDAYFNVGYGLLPLAFWFIALFLTSDLCLLKKGKYSAALCAVGGAAVLLFI